MDIWGPLSLAGYPWLSYFSQVQHKKEHFHEPRVLERTVASWQEAEIETQAWNRGTGSQGPLCHLTGYQGEVHWRPELSGERRVSPGQLVHLLE